MTRAPHPGLRLLPQLTRGNGAALVAIVVPALLSAAATLVLPMVAAGLIASLQSGEAVTPWATAMVAVGVGATLAGALSSYLLARTAQAMLLQLRVRTMEHTLYARVRDAQRLGTGNLATRLTQDAASVRSGVEVAVQLPISAVILLGTVVIMAVLDWVLLIVTLAAFAVAFVGVGVVVVALRRRYGVMQQAIGRLSETFVVALDGLPIIKAYRAEAATLADLGQEAEHVGRTAVSAARLESLLAPVLNLGQQVALVSVLIGGGVRLVSGDLGLAAFVAFLMYLLQLAAPLMTAISGFATLQAGLAARSRFDEVFGLEREDAADPAPVQRALDAPTDVAGGEDGRSESALSFTGVRFGYDDDPVLHDVDLVVPARGLTALVGPSGAGKSTVLALAEGFLTPTNGTVRVLGRDRSEWRLAELRRHLGYVDQRFTLLRGTVRANLTLGGDPRTSDEALYDVLSQVALDDVVRALPDGLDTWIGNGTDLSGGQSQRLALARMLVTPTRLVLLDEPTSQLDSLSEGRLRAVVDDLARDRAVLVVAHRMSTVQHADHVIVLDEGRVVAQGSHDRLLQECAPYARLVRGQLLSRPEPSYA